MAKPKVVSFPAVPTKQPKKPRNLRDDGRKQVQLDIGYDPKTGKRLRKYFYGKTLKEANAKKDEWVAEQNKPDPATDPAQTVAEWVERWKDAYGKNASYSVRVNREPNIARVIEHLGALRLCEVRPIDVQNFANLYAGLSKSSHTKMKTLLNRVFGQAVSNGLIEKNPCDGAVWSSGKSGTHRYLSKDEIHVITENYTAYRAGIWAMLMLYAGLRRGEALALQWGDIDFDQNTITISRALHFEGNQAVIGSPKTSSGVRTVPLLPPLKRALESVPLPHISEYICTGMKGQIVTSAILKSSWRAYLNTMANVINRDTKQPLTPGRRSDKDANREVPRRAFAIQTHDLRHTFCSMLYDAGVDVKTAQKLMGHSSPEITMRIYTHLSTEKEKLSIGKMEKFVEQFDK